MTDITLTAAGRAVTGLASEITLSASLDTLGSCLTCTVPWQEGMDEIAALADPVRLYRGAARVFSGIVTKVEASENARRITAYDFAYYLNKSKITIQFCGVSVTEALRATFAAAGVSSFLLPNIAVTAEETCLSETPAAIIAKLLTRARDVGGIEYHAYADPVREGTVDIEEVGQTAVSVALREITAPSRTISLDEVRNRVTYTDSEGTDTGISAEDAASIARYGLLADVLSSSSDDLYAPAIVQMRVRRQKDPLPTAELECAGHFFPRPGQRVPLTVPSAGSAGEWVVSSVAHTLHGGEHRMKLSVRRQVYGRSYAEEVREANRQAVEDAARRTGSATHRSASGEVFGGRDGKY